METQKFIVIAAIIIASLAVGYLKEKKKMIALAVLGVLVAFYAADYLM